MCIKRRNTLSFLHEKVCIFATKLLFLGILQPSRRYYDSCRCRGEGLGMAEVVHEDGRRHTTGVPDRQTGAKEVVCYHKTMGQLRVRT